MRASMYQILSSAALLHFLFMPNGKMLNVVPEHLSIGTKDILINVLSRILYLQLFWSHASFLSHLPPGFVLILATNPSQPKMKSAEEFFFWMQRILSQLVKVRNTWYVKLKKVTTTKQATCCMAYLITF